MTEKEAIENIMLENYIPKSKIKDKIDEYKNILKKCNNKKDLNRIKSLNERILAYKELL